MSNFFLFCNVSFYTQQFVSTILFLFFFFFFKKISFMRFFCSNAFLFRCFKKIYKTIVKRYKNFAGQYYQDLDYS